ncbi:hypothetical protein BT96DRAFT_932682 [Gymnopus androsaceus JB14]|uniref:Uncharacterized protein n=1 Tax=Gymnopus androsaceus JB14 TaxID=1447944 RepID=A0A6A4ID07_9AGAR|nr:hypothetical protein BT96DRAFT_932682 [Gymnopus androsaceus JB14]
MPSPVPSDSFTTSSSITRQFNKATISRRFKMAPHYRGFSYDAYYCSNISYDVFPRLPIAQKDRSSHLYRQLWNHLWNLSLGSSNIVFWLTLLDCIGLHPSITSSPLSTLAPALCFQAHQFFGAIEILRLAQDKGGQLLRPGAHAVRFSAYNIMIYVPACAVNGQCAYDCCSYSRSFLQAEYNDDGDDNLCSWVIAPGRMLTVDDE